MRELALGIDQVVRIQKLRVNEDFADPAASGSALAWRDRIGRKPCQREVLRGNRFSSLYSVWNVSTIDTQVAVAGGLAMPERNHR